jgi:hypothetical protein
MPSVENSKSTIAKSVRKAINLPFINEGTFREFRRLIKGKVTPTKEGHQVPVIKDYK